MTPLSGLIDARLPNWQANGLWRNSAIAAPLEVAKLFLPALKSRRRVWIFGHPFQMETNFDWSIDYQLDWYWKQRIVLTQNFKSGQLQGFAFGAQGTAINNVQSYSNGREVLRFCSTAGTEWAETFPVPLDITADLVIYTCNSLVLGTATNFALALAVLSEDP